MPHIKDKVAFIRIEKWDKSTQIIDEMTKSDLNFFFLNEFSNELDEVVQNYIDHASNIPIVAITSEDKNIKQLSGTLEMIIDNMTSITLSDFEKDIAKNVISYLPLEKEDKEKKIDNSTINNNEDFSIKKSKQKEVEADYSLNHKSSKKQEVEAGYSLKQQSKEQQDQDADYSLKHQSKEQQDQDADYSLKHQSKEQQDQDADYSLKHQSKKHQDQDADYSLKHQSKEQQDQDADYSLKHQSKEQQYELSEDEINRKKIETMDFETNEVSENYRKIKISKIKSIKQVNMDIFLRIAPEKFIKIVNNNESGDIKDICLKYIKKGFTFFYLTKENHQNFIEEQTQAVKNLLSKMSLDAETKAMGSLVIQSGIKNKIQDLGITESVVEDVKAVMDQSKQVLTESKDLKGLFEKVMKGRDYISEHSMMVTLVVGHIAHKISWMNSTAIEKLSMAAILHDSAFTNEKLAVYDNIMDTDLNANQKKEIKEHPFEAANMIRNSGLLLPDIDNIIEQHHEKPDGSGFPRGISSTQISPLSATFILCEKFSKDYLRGVALDEIKNDINENYNRGNFRAAASAILESF